MSPIVRLPFVIGLSACSGIAALIYEIVWFQVLELIIGSAAISVGLVLAVFMGGTCLGSLLIPRWMGGLRPLRAYAALEVGIAVSGGLVLWIAPALSGLYGDGGSALHAAVVALCIVLPTLLMGATLPILGRVATGGSPEGPGWLYAANIAGGAAGCLVAGFYLLPRHDLITAAAVATALNALAAIVALALPVTASVPSRSSSREPGASAIHVVLAISGLCALGSQTLWNRTLGLLFGASAYTLSLIVAVFLVGLGCGSAAGAWLCRAIKNPRQMLAWCQILAAAAMAWAAYLANAAFPYWPVNPSIATSIAFNFQIDLFRALLALLPATLLWGASFPLALATAGRGEPGGGDQGNRMGHLYAANTLGAVVGALAVTFVLIPRLGTQHAQQILIALSAMAGIAILGASARIAGSSAVALTVLALWTVPPRSDLLVAHGRYAATWVGKGDILYSEDGLTSSVAVSEFPGGARTFHVAGKIQASNVPRDLRLQRMLGHLTTLTARSPRSVLVIGCGAGVTAGAVSIDPRVEVVHLAEIERLVPKAAAAHFGDANFEVLRNPKLRLHIDDGRHFLMTSTERFDAITADPLDPWVKGAANLYTTEFLESARAHLNPGGVLTLYVQLFETNAEAVRSLAATFFKVFPDATVWGNPVDGRGHDMVLMGRVDGAPISVAGLETQLTSREYSRVLQSLQQVDMASAADLFSTYAGRAQDLGAWVAGAPLNTDRNLRMQYLAGLGLNRDDSAAIYSEMLRHRRYPVGLFADALPSMLSAP